MLKHHAANRLTKEEGPASTGPSSIYNVGKTTSTCPHFVLPAKTTEKGKNGYLFGFSK